MDCTYYANKIFEMLNDSQTYEEITTNKNKNVMKLIKELAGNHSHNLIEKEVSYVCHFDFKTSGFYGLPKIHKSKIICQEAKVQKKPKTVPERTILVSFDVTSLYTNIKHKLGVKAIEYWINKHPGSLNPHFSKEFIIDSVLFKLTNNTFTFDDRIFLQKKGTAMGTKMAPSYATLVLGYLENELYSQVSRKMGEETGHYIYKNWRRFLDDCYINWP